MPPKKKQTSNESLEATLWAAADKLRGKMDSAVYKPAATELIIQQAEVMAEDLG